MNMLDQISLSPHAVQSWHEVCCQVTREEERETIFLCEEENARENGDGTLTIFVSYEGKDVISLIIPKDQWCWNN